MALVTGVATMQLAAQATSPSPADNALAREVLRQLIEIDTTDSSGSTTVAAEAIRRRFLDAGFPAADIASLGPDPRHGNLVVRYRGRAAGAHRPVLLLGHLDVVEAKREDWSTGPFVLTEKDGYLYGRGTQDMKDSDAAMVTALLRLKREGFVPDRDIVLALTADEEGGAANGVSWLLSHHRDLIDAGFALNPDAGGLNTIKGRPQSLGVEATEKLYADFRLTVTDRGGHSSLPRQDNAIYRLAAALGRLERYRFPAEINTVTRGYFAAIAKTVSPSVAQDMRAILKTPASEAAINRLSAQPIYNAVLRTTCVATMLSGGHAPNALPQRATANINCRILPGHTPGSIREQLVKVLADPQIKVQLLNDDMEPSDAELNDVSVAPPPLNEEVFSALHEVAGRLWPGVPIIPEMETGASDSKYTMSAGIPTYGFSGMGIDEDDSRAHGRDERIGINAYYAGAQFEYLYLKALTAGKR